MTAIAAAEGWAVLRVIDDYAGIPRTVVFRNPVAGGGRAE